ncbi:MBL fold metallo-hydrolase [Streptomyces sp. RFCAC02]|uniref:MBL fold metallo-hydrolase n=1 Tax=Streptomyces sp. RFCAC02 TaxID=2499143 RepID=UPI0010207CB3|nr:MBL fold metallo-hydrolase [Streptomyces sp. RFCAC02]
MTGDWEEVAAGVLRRRLAGWDETAGAVAVPGGVLLVDAGPTAAAGAELTREACELLGAPVTHLVVTHPHFDHILGAGAVTAAFPGVTVHGPRLEGPDPVAGVVADAVRHGVPAAEAAQAGRLLAAAPCRAVSGDAPVSGPAGGPRARLLDLGAAHSPHDVAVVVEGTPRVVFCGDLVEESGEPQAGPDAVPARWPAALDRLLAAGGPDALYVPGHGAVVGAAFVRAQRDALRRRFGAAPS